MSAMIPHLAAGTPATATIPEPVWYLTIGTTLVLIAVLVVAVRRASRDGAGGGALLTGAFLLSWLVSVGLLANAGVFRGSASSPPRIAPPILVPLVAGALVLATSSAARRFLMRVPQPWLISVQAVRMVGIVFLVLEARGVLPAHFALPAGIGDFAIGAAAPFVALAIARGADHARAVAIAWNLLGILDLLVAVTIGGLTAESAIRAFHTIPSTEAMTVLPLSTIPTFAVPVFILLHVASLMSLRRAAGGVTEPTSRSARRRGGAHQMRESPLASTRSRAA